MPEFKDITGQTFGDGKVLALKRVPDHIKPNGKHVTRYLCKCVCGRMFVAARYNLVDNHTTSCGCSRGKKKGNGMKCCAFHPASVDCQVFECDTCGWNPYNEELREKRINEIKKKVGMAYDESDENRPAAEDT